MSQLKVMLQTVKKGPLNINKYLLKTKNAVDRLASVNHVVSDLNHVEAIFNGLLEE